MIPKIDSQELNNIFEDASSKIDILKNQIATIRNDMTTKLKVINYESEYILNKMNDIENNNTIENKNYIRLSKIKDENNIVAEKYGKCIHAKLLKQPINIFNLKMSGLNESFFRDDVKAVLIHNEKEDVWTDVLKDDSIDNKLITFDLFDTRNITLSVQIKDPTALLGATRFNCIEIDPFLPGSFDITNIKIYYYEEDGVINTTTPYTVQTINSRNTNSSVAEEIGKTRFICNKKINAYRIDFDITINHRVESNDMTLYPFGLKHIYFYEMDFNENSYIIAPITIRDNIDYIKEEIIIKSPYGEDDSTISSENIKLYLKNIDGELSYQIEPSSGSNIKEIPIDTNTIYAKIPISPVMCIEGIYFDVVSRVVD